MAKLDQYLTVAEAAAYVGVARNTIRNWAIKGKIPEYRNSANNYRLFKTTDLDGLIQQTHRPTSTKQRRPKPR
ncbi:MAG: MerR family transcriptional regulator [Planctomycetes bacterium RBG_16_64_10]|nr:MAG: MerR family transcriptional regulator [Planctomycetes bacterium RBG_16_64_10]